MIKATKAAQAKVMGINYEPGNGTSYRLFFADATAVCEQIGAGKSIDRAECLIVTLVNFPNRPSLVFWPEYGVPMPSYITEKMGLGDADAEAVAAAIRQVLGYAP